MSKMLGFLGAFIFVVYFYGFAGLLRIGKAKKDANFAIYGIMLLVNVAAWIITKNLINKYIY